MIDHISIAVRDLTKGEKLLRRRARDDRLFQTAEWPDAAIGFGKKYPEFWINKREAWGASPTTAACTSACARPIRQRSTPFTPPRLKTAAPPTASQECGAHYHEGYYAAFVRDLDGNRIEAVTFVRDRQIKRVIPGQRSTRLRCRSATITAFGKFPDLQCNTALRLCCTASGKRA